MRSGTVSATHPLCFGAVKIEAKPMGGDILAADIFNSLVFRCSNALEVPDIKRHSLNMISPASHALKDRQGTRSLSFQTPV